MNKSVLSILFLAFYLSSFATSFSIDTKTITGSVDCFASSHFTNHITNHGISNISLGWRIIENTLPLPVCWTYMICDMQLCYPGIPQDGNGGMGSLAPGNSDELFDLEISTNGNSGSGRLKLYVYNTANPTDGDTVIYNISGCDTGNSCPLSIKEKMDYSFIHIYPNPARNVINIEITNNLQLTNVSLSDVFGKKVEGLKIMISSCSMRLNIAGLPAGVYFLRIEEDYKYYYFKKINIIN